jgi:hypothetical protein
MAMKSQEYTAIFVPAKRYLDTTMPLIASNQVDRTSLAQLWQVDRHAVLPKNFICELWSLSDSSELSMMLV